MDLSRLSRLTAILTHLQSKRLITSTYLAKKFEVSVRTIYRDIKALESAGVPIITEDGKGYSLMEGYNLPPVMFTEEEANALITAEKIISKNKEASLINNYSSAITKIKSILRYNDKDKTNLLSDRIAYIKNFPQDTTSNYLSTIQIAITNFIVCKIKYESLYKKEVSFRDIEAQALYHTQDNWILIAWCQLRNDYREFRLDQIRTIQLLDQKFDVRDFHLMDYFQTKLERQRKEKGID